MKSSTNTSPIAKIVGEEKAVEYIAKAGFDAWDFSMFSMCNYDWRTNQILENNHSLASSDYLKFARKLRQIGLDNGIVCNQSHAPFPTSCPQIVSFLKRAIECTAEAGGEICVIHPKNNATPEENGQMFMELLPFAKECNVKIATENMWNWDREKGHSSFAACATPKSFCEHLEYVNDENFVACLDIGHAEMKGSDTNAVEMILALSKKLCALHIHDNDKLNDSHQIPFSMNIDFKAIVEALKKINYGGYFTLEADMYLANHTEDNVFDGVLDLASSVKKMAEMFDNE